MMKGLRITALIAGILATIIGIIWIGQGTGYFPYPATSFMINQSPWIYRGAGLAMAGLIVAFWAKRG